jgi:hypothetical protein
LHVVDDEYPRPLDEEKLCAKDHLTASWNAFKPGQTVATKSRAGRDMSIGNAWSNMIRMPPLFSTLDTSTRRPARSRIYNVGR